LADKVGKTNSQEGPWRKHDRGGGDKEEEVGRKTSSKTAQGTGDLLGKKSEGEFFWS